MTVINLYGKAKYIKNEIEPNHRTNQIIMKRITTHSHSKDLLEKNSSIQANVATSPPPCRSIPNKAKSETFRIIKVK